MAKTISHRYTDQERERGLVALALASGNTVRAQEALAAQGLRVGRTTLWEWKTKLHRAEYEELRERTLPAIRAYAAEKHMELADAEMETSAQLLERLKDEAGDIPVRDLP